MGREAQVEAVVAGTRGAVKALLESHELILRGALRHRFPRADISDIAVTDAALTFRCGETAVRLELGAAQAAAWHRALLTPPPSLRDKLGLGPAARAWVLGPDDDAALAEALAPARADSLAAAAMVIARVDSAADLAAARALAGPAGLPLWVVHGKGPAAPFGDGAVRAALRAAGWRDTKTCAVSARLTATRYHPGPQAAA